MGMGGGILADQYMRSRDDKKLVFIAHPVGGDVEGNIEKILELCKEIHYADDNVIPFAPYLTQLRYLNDGSPEEREMGIGASYELFRRQSFDELWLCGSRISPGMEQEVLWATYNRIPVDCYNPDLKLDLEIVLRELRLKT